MNTSANVISRSLDDRRRARRQRALVVQGEPVPHFFVAGTTQLGSIASKLTKECFVGSRWDPDGRYSEFDNRLPAIQPGAYPSVISAVAPSLKWKLAEAAAAVLGMDINWSSIFLQESLIERGYIVTPPQVEAIVEATERAEKTGVPTNGDRIMFFLGTGNWKNPVSGGCIRRPLRNQWTARFLEFNEGAYLNAVLLVPNLSLKL